MGGGGAGGAEGGKTGIHHSLTRWPTLSPTTAGHFSGTFFFFFQGGAQKELAGGVVSLFPM